MDYSLLDLESLLRKYGRGVVFYHHDGGSGSVGDPARWDATSKLELAHLGDTEGDIVFEANQSVATLTLPEISGTAIHEGTYTGENPQLQIPLFLADPDLLPIVSPIGQAGAGHIRVREVSERSLVLFPESLFRKADGTYATLDYDDSIEEDWALDGQALTADQETLLELAVFFWRGYFERPSRSFLGGHGDDGKNITQVNFNVMMHPDIVDGQRLYTVGDPNSVSIDISGAS